MGSAEVDDLRWPLVRQYLRQEFADLTGLLRDDIRAALDGALSSFKAGSASSLMSKVPSSMHQGLTSRTALSSDSGFSGLPPSPSGLLPWTGLSTDVSAQRIDQAEEAAEDCPSGPMQFQETPAFNQKAWRTYVATSGRARHAHGEHKGLLQRTSERDRPAELASPQTSVSSPRGEPAVPLSPLLRAAGVAGQLKTRRSVSFFGEATTNDLSDSEQVPKGTQPNSQPDDSNVNSTLSFGSSGSKIFVGMWHSVGLRVTTKRSLFMPHPAQRESQADKPDVAPPWRTPCAACAWRLRVVVESAVFNYTIAAVILANACLMGVQVQLEAEAARSPEPVPIPPGLRLISLLFCVAFTTELVLRIMLYRLDFFVGCGWRWNMFDITIVGLQLAEEVGEMQAADSLGAVLSQQRDGNMSLSFMRILRVLRLIRIVRVVRILRLVRELRAMVHSIASTMFSLFWTLLLLSLLIYVVAICFTQLVADSGMTDQAGLAVGTKAYEYFGSLDRSFISLYQALTGGVDWKDLQDVLVDRSSPWAALAFCGYIAFAVLAMLNVITGVFVGSAVAKAHEEDNIDLVLGLRDAVETMMVPGSSELSWVGFQSQLGRQEIISFFKSIDLDPSEAEGLFRLLDPEDVGLIDAEDFVMGCLRLHGAAKAIDLTTLMCEVRWLRKAWVEHARWVEESLVIATKLLHKQAAYQARSVMPCPVNAGAEDHWLALAGAAIAARTAARGGAAAAAAPGSHSAAALVVPLERPSAEPPPVPRWTL